MTRHPMVSVQEVRLSLLARFSLLYRTLFYYWSNRSLRAWARLVAFPFLRLLGHPAPIFVDIATTYRCQCRCVHCSAEGHKKPHEEEMDTAEIKSVIDQARDIGALQIILTGGEPLLRDDTIEIVRYAHEAGMITRLNTNGLLLNRATVSELKKAGLTICAVSLDRADAEAHDSLRQVPGIYAKALAGIRLLREFRLPVEILTYAVKENLDSHLRDITALGRQLDLSLLFVFFPIASGRWYSAFDQMLNSEERAVVRRAQSLTFVYAEIPTKGSICCHCQKYFIYFTSSGDVKPCPFFHPRIGNIRKHPLKDMWYRYCSELKFKFRDDCPLNNAHNRGLFEGFVESFAQRYAGPR